MGIAFSLKTFTTVEVTHVVLFAVASFLLVAYVFALNDWVDITADSNDFNKSAKAFPAKGTSQSDMRNLSLGLGALSLFLFSLLPFRTFLIAVAIAALGFVYSHPVVRTKCSPLVSSVTHLTGGVLHFLMGYSLFRQIDERGVLIAFFFALTFTAGHLTQEVQDYRGDRLNGTLTSAVKFGKDRVFVASQIIFLLAFVHFTLLAFSGLVPRPLVLVALLYPFILFASVRTFQAGLTFENLSRFRTYYRALYALIGLAMMAFIVLRKHWP
ncbi:MAG: UbiA family prenyltransferase [Planctomycetota bacterium]|jgi:4-hydroxybenzoate polyprenyltransferase